ncbi:carbohydrate porin [Acinetobacter sp.]|uniref:carbohydrate porin n=1 Tax=Acinetobacter sp. TaxID=472 RepID=UPI000C09E832|nr:carbohydrate porin [Acinetobacter sp.]MAK29155.1 carbohydrate porin [Acinetobacter sp.]
MKLGKTLAISCISMLSLSIWTQQVSAASAFDPSSEWMLGDWNGERTALKQKGYDVSIGYTGEMATVLDSKDTSRHGTEYAGQVALGTHFDLNKILGWQDTEAQITLTHRDGHDIKNKAAALEGQLSSTQEVYGRGQTTRLTDLWIKKKFFDQALDIKVGRFGESEDFNPAACDFQNLALCGDQMGNWNAGDQIHNWPVSQWAARVKYNVTPEVFAQVGVYEYNPENLKRSKGFNLSTDGSKGAVIPVEVVWQPKSGLINGLAGEYRAGYYYSTADANEINSTNKDHGQGGWLSFIQQLTAVNGDTSRGLKVVGQATFFDEATSRVKNTQSLAFAYKGLVDTRPKDELAIGFSRINLNDDAYLGKDVDSEYNSEIYYGIEATNWLTVRPNVQYVRHVGALKDGNNAWVGGIKFQTVF